MQSIVNAIPSFLVLAACMLAAFQVILSAVGTFLAKIGKAPRVVAFCASWGKVFHDIEMKIEGFEGTFSNKVSENKPAPKTPTVPPAAVLALLVLFPVATTAAIASSGCSWFSSHETQVKNDAIELGECLVQSFEDGLTPEATAAKCGSLTFAEVVDLFGKMQATKTREERRAIADHAIAAKHEAAASASHS